MKIKSMKFWNLIGIIVGIAIIVTGVVVMMNPPMSFTTVRSEEVTFGGDFYTYEYSATRNAGINAAVTANNIREVGQMITFYAGLIFIVWGLLTTVKYAKRFCVEVDYIEDEDFDYEEIMAAINEEFANAENIEEAPVETEEPVAEEAPVEAEEPAAEQVPEEPETV